MLDELLSSFSALSEEELEQHKKATLQKTSDLYWIPNPGPQTDGYFTEADELFYGGAAGGGKTDLLIGLALDEHHKSLIVRREGPDLDAMEGRFKEIIGHTNGWNGQDRKWRLGSGHEIKLGSCKNEDDKHGYQGQAHDLKAFDEVCQFTESQFRYICGWNRTTKQGQRCRVVATGNPPTTPEGYWVKEYWGPWLDPTFPDPAEPGELRWATTDPATGKTIWVDEDWSKVDEATGETIHPRSRTFIPALTKDNPFLDGDYIATIAAMPEPLRSQLMYGDFNVAEKDQANQVIPTAWVREAQKRWTPTPPEGARMLTMGADIAQGGDDETVGSPLYAGGYFGEQIVEPGTNTPGGPEASALLVSHLRNGAQVNVDMGGGYGQSTYDHLQANGILCFQMIPSGKSEETVTLEQTEHNSGGSAEPIHFVNKRAEWHWKFREALDPKNNPEIALPPDERMVADLCAPTWKLTPRGIQIESKEQVKKRLGRSPDRGESILLAHGEARQQIMNMLDDWPDMAVA